jgi:Na+/proline symporter
MGTALHWLDWTVIAGYFVMIMIVGLVAGRRIKKTDDYFLGHRGFSVWLVIAQAFGVGTHAEMPVSLAGKVYLSGYAGIWYQWKNLFITPFYWLLAPLFRRFRRTTTGEVYEDRYGNLMGAVYTAFALSYFVFNMGAMLKGAGKLVSVAMGDQVTPNTVVLVMTVTFVAYSFVGGLIAAAWTDFVQSFFIIALSFLLIPLGLGVIGGFGGLRQTLQPQMLSMVTPGDVGVFTIVMLTLNGLIGIVAQPHILASVGTGHDENSCRWGMAAGNFIKRFCTIGWALVGLIVAAMLVQRGAAPFADSEEAFGYATRELLFPGAVGLMIACVLAANMSTGSAFTVDGGALFTQNFYRRYLVREGSDRHYLLVGRLAGVLVTTTGVVFGLYVDSVLEAFLFTETIAAFMGISMFGAISWRRANRYGAFASLVVSCGTFFYLTYQDYLVAFAADPHTTVHPFLQWDATNFGIALLAGFVSLAIVSLLTKPEPETLLDEFYGRLRTASYLDRATGEEATHQQSGNDLLFVNLFDLQLSKGWKHFYNRFRIDLIGLLLAFGVVAALIALAKGILYLP